MKKVITTVAFYETQLQAGDAIHKLKKSGFDMKMLSLVGSDFQSETVTGYYNIGESRENWVSYGTLWGGAWKLLLGSAFFIIPPIGPVLIAGPLVAALAGSLQNIATAGRHGVLGSALVSLGITDHTVFKYENEIQAGKFMLLMHGTEANMEKVSKTLDLPWQGHTKHEGHKIVLSGGEHSAFQ